MDKLIIDDRGDKIELDFMPGLQIVTVDVSKDYDVVADLHLSRKDAIRLYDYLGEVLAL